MYSLAYAFVVLLLITHSYNIVLLLPLLRKNNRDVVQYLLNEAHCNPNCIDKNGSTPLSMTRDPIISKELISNGANPAVFYQRHGKELPAVSVNTFVIGRQGCGKSTLSKALGKQSKGLARLTSRVVKVTGVDEKTAGITPYDIHNDHFGHLALYDFAGHEEYYASHCTVIRSVTMGSSAALFLLVADLRSNDTELRSTISYSPLCENRMHSEYSWSRASRHHRGQLCRQDQVNIRVDEEA